jgi:hypothetical protein
MAAAFGLHSYLLLLLSWPTLARHTSKQDRNHLTRRECYGCGMRYSAAFVSRLAISRRSLPCGRTAFATFLGSLTVIPKTGFELGRHFGEALPRVLRNCAKLLALELLVNFRALLCERKSGREEAKDDGCGGPITRRATKNRPISAVTLCAGVDSHHLHRCSPWQKPGMRRLFLLDLDKSDSQHSS